MELEEEAFQRMLEPFDPIQSSSDEWVARRQNATENPGEENQDVLYAEPTPRQR